MTVGRVALLVGVAVLVLVANVTASILYMVVYGHVIDPGHDPQYYNDHIQVAGPYCSIVAGIPLMFLAGWWVAGWWRRALGVRAAWIVWLAYAVIDLAALLAAGMSMGVGLLFVVSFATKWQQCTSVRGSGSYDRPNQMLLSYFVRPRKAIPMIDWFRRLAAGSELPMNAASELEERGFVVIPGPVPSDRMELLADAYTAAVASASGDDIKVGSTSTRVSDFVNRGEAFDDLYVYPPLLEACCHVIGRPFKLSSLLARTLQPRTPTQELHVDVRRDSADWPLLGFILMVDEFRRDNGATRFVPGSHRWSGTPDVQAEPDRHVLACGSAGSLVVFNGSVWHGHAANTSSGPRRSLQGAFIPRNGRAGTDFAVRMQPETRARLSPLAREVLAL